MHKKSCGLRVSCPVCEYTWEKCECEDPPSCMICLESNRKLLRGCACRGSCGFVHVACMVDANKYRKGEHDTCMQCEQKFVGELQCELAKARVRSTALHDFDTKVVSDLASGLASRGDYSGALRLYKKVVKYELMHLGPNHPAVGSTYMSMGTMCHKTGFDERALKYFNMSAEIYKNAYSVDHPDVGAVYTK